MEILKQLCYVNKKMPKGIFLFTFHMKSIIYILTFTILHSTLLYSQNNTVGENTNIFLNEVKNLPFTELNFNKVAFYSIDIDLVSLKSFVNKIPDNLKQDSRFIEIVKNIQWKEEFIGKKIDIRLFNKIGEVVNLSNLAKKNGFILIDLWATWCEPCIIDFIYLNKLVKKIQHLNIVCISIDEDKLKWIEKINNNTLNNFFHLIDHDKEVFNQLKLETIPRKILLDSNLNIINIFSSKITGKHNLEKYLSVN